ncbi:DUF6204 family protein [Actinoplanes sp. N902-109]|uniref:DUF6204 family protein n=1 Tax=Actinoplanes sp. (strain N902-109) TaxID=649831 RepID=UPI00032965A8|nr:DUF6204 family protein [Actinoplanes sp. N902-109]AGL17466.1 hypothetical protein L083_3956 [Actinoplanes sp. N902-109]
MSPRTIRVTVRGAFDALTDAQRTELLAAAAEHDVVFAAFTPTGSMTYDIAARPFFTFRYQGSAGSDDDIPAVTARAQAAAVQWLDTRGYAYKNLSSQTTDMSQIPLGARGKRRQSA